MTGRDLRIMRCPCCCGCAAAFAIFALWPGLDLWVTGLFYDPGGRVSDRGR